MSGTAAALLLALLASSGAPSSRVGALDALADRLLQAVDGRLQPPVAVSVTGSSQPLAQAFASLLAAKLARQRQAPFVLPTPGAADEAAARQRGASCLLRLQVTLEGDTLWARGDLLGTWVNFWSGATPTRPPTPAQALVARIGADATAVALASAPRLAPRFALAADPRPLLALDERIAALSARDLDGDGRPELLVLTDQRVLILAANGTVRAQRSLASLPDGPAPSREPYGLIWGDAHGQVDYLLARLGRGERLQLTDGGTALAFRAAIDQLEICGAPARLVPGQTAFELADGGRFTACAQAPGTGGGHDLWVTDQGRGRLDGRDLGPLATASTLCAWGRTGPPCWATTSAEVLPAPDFVDLRQGQQSLLWTPVPVAGRILQLVSTDLDGDGQDELVLGLWPPDGGSRLEMLRRSAP